MMEIWESQNIGNWKTLFFLINCNFTITAYTFFLNVFNLPL